MSETVSIEMPDAVIDRFRRAAESAQKPVQELLVNALAHFSPKPPPGLPDEIRKRLEDMESLSDSELEDIFSATLDREELGDSYVPGDESDMLMLSKAYAGVLLQWRGHELPALQGAE